MNVQIQGANGVLDIPGNGSASVYYHGSWQKIDGVNANNRKMVQATLEPGTYTFAATYDGTRDSQVVTVGASAKTVYFQAAAVTLGLQNHSGSSLAADSASYYAGQWNTMAGAQAEMLPGTYSFAATYNGTRQQQNFTIVKPNSNNQANRYQTAGFQTTLVNVQLSDSNKAIVSGSASYYANGWHAITGVNHNNPKMVQAEMLPGTYSFAAVYDNVRQQKNGVTIGTGNANHIQSVYFGF
ncbi:MAG: hypothetical protein ABI746_10535 [Dermatophilaceae bacterium]